MRAEGWRLRSSAAASPLLPPELLGGKRALGGVSVTRTSVLTPPRPGSSFHPEGLHLFDLGDNPSVELEHTGRICGSDNNGCHN